MRGFFVLALAACGGQADSAGYSSGRAVGLLARAEVIASPAPALPAATDAACAPTPGGFGHGGADPAFVAGFTDAFAEALPGVAPTKLTPTLDLPLPDLSPLGRELPGGAGAGGPSPNLGFEGATAATDALCNRFYRAVHDRIAGCEAFVNNDDVVWPPEYTSGCTALVAEALACRDVPTRVSDDVIACADATIHEGIAPDCHPPTIALAAVPACDSLRRLGLPLPPPSLPPQMRHPVGQ